MEGNADMPAEQNASSCNPGTRILTRTEVEGLLDVRQCIDAVEDAFRAHAGGRSIPPGVLGAPTEGGGFHLKTAGLTGDRPYFAAKLNGNFYRNAERFGLPRIQGLIVLADAVNGYPLAVMDSTHITLLRTAAATAVAARHLAREDSAVVTVCGCGVQGKVQLEALRVVRPIEAVYLVDADLRAAERLAADLGDGLVVEVLALENLSRATRCSDVCITATPSHTPLLGVADVALGAFVAAVGADSEDKQELTPELLRISRIVVDHLEQCATIGELHHGLESGLVSRSDVYGELHEVVAGLRPGRTDAWQRFIFDSTGVALEDVAAAALVYQRALTADAGEVIQVLR